MFFVWDDGTQLWRWTVAFLIALPRGHDIAVGVEHVDRVAFVQAVEFVEMGITRNCKEKKKKKKKKKMYNIRYIYVRYMCSRLLKC